MTRVALIEGEDSAPEAVRPTVELISRLAPDIEWVRPVVGAEAMKEQGHPFPDDARELIDSCEAALFGATSGLSALALLHLRQGRQTYANLRPVKHFPGYITPLARPEDVDFVVVRENIEDLYLFVEGDLFDLDLEEPLTGKPVSDRGPGKFAVKAISEMGSERIARWAFALAEKRKAAGHGGKVTCGTKRNVLPQSDGLFAQKAQEVSEEFPDIEFEQLLVDDLGRRMISHHRDLDVVLLPNQYGDLLSDVGAGLTGGLGVAPSGCYGDDFAYFEPVHGTAPDITGQGIMNPTATLLSGALLLDLIGLSEASANLTGAVAAMYEERDHLTPDQDGNATTDQFMTALESRLGVE